MRAELIQPKATARELKANELRLREQTVFTLIKLRLKRQSQSALKFMNSRLTKISGA